MVEKYLTNSPVAWLCRIDCSVIVRQFGTMCEGWVFFDLSTSAKVSRWADPNVCPRAFNFAVADKEVRHLVYEVPPAAMKRIGTNNLPVYRSLTSNYTDSNEHHG